MWIANNGEATVSKWDTDNNVELARYPTWFGTGARWGTHDGPGPSRTCVDISGNCYVANRHLYDPQPADVIKILADDWIDRNGNGVMDTSWDVNGDGTISVDELLPMEDTNGNDRIDPDEIKDERVAWAVSVGPDNGVGRSLSIDPNGNLWLGLYNAQAYYKLSGVDGSILAGPISTPGHTPYGSLVYKYGILWGASLDYDLLKLDTNTNTFLGTYTLPDLSYGIALGYDNAENTIVYLGGRWYSTFVKFNSSSEIATTPAELQYEVFGIATDAQGNILAGHGSNGEMNKFAPNGSLIWHANAQIASHIRGTVVDSNGDVWALHLNDNKMAKFDGQTGAPLGVFNTGSYPYTYSDAAGLGYSSSVLSGKWNVVHDSFAPGTIWGTISWNSDEPEGTSITVKTRSSEDQITWSSWENVLNDITLITTPPGRYIEIEVTMKITSGDVSPILYDITIEGTCASCTDSNPPIVNILDPQDGEMRTSSPSQLIIEAYDEETSVVDVYAKIHDATTNLFFNGTGWQDSEAWLFCTSDINDQWYLDTDWSDELNHTYHITAEAYDECGNIGTDMHMFTIVAEEQQTYSISGTIYYPDVFDEGVLRIVLFNEPVGPETTPMNFIEIYPYDFSEDYTFNNLTPGTYYVAAQVDLDDSGGPPSEGELDGYAINKTSVDEMDAINIIDTNVYDVDVTLFVVEGNSPPVVDITYPEDDDVVNSDVLTITGTAYDEDTFVDEVQVQLYYYDDEFTVHYYNDTLGDWSLDPYSFTASGTGAGTLADPLLWKLSIEPVIFPIGYNSFEVYAIVSDHDAIPLTSADSNWFDWNLEQD
jgi:hypothetical protein